MPYLQLTILVSLVLTVVVTAPFSSQPRVASVAARRVASPPSVPSDLASVGGGGNRALPLPATPSIDPHELAAERAASELLDEVAVPAGAVPTAALPAGTTDMGGPPQMVAVAQLIDDHRFWVVPGSPDGVLSWMSLHHLAGETLMGRGTEATYDVQQLAFISYFTPMSRSFLSGGVLAGVAQDGAGQVVLRVDSQVVWEPTRPITSMVPGSAATMVVTDTPQPKAAGGVGTPRSRTSSDASVVDHFIAVVNALPESTSGFINCPAFSGDRYTVVFESRARATLDTVTFYQDVCFGFSISAASGPPVPLVDPGQALLHAVLQFVGAGASSHNPA
ncbi:MAG: hypothetical protein WAM97_02235 [Acidimicrobiales bacterium]